MSDVLRAVLGVLVFPGVRGVLAVLGVLTVRDSFSGDGGVEGGVCG